MWPSPQTRQSRSSTGEGGTAADGTAPVQPTSSGDSSPAGAVWGVAETSSVPSGAAPPPGPASVAVQGRAEVAVSTTRSAPHASQKLDSAGLAVPHAWQVREAAFVAGAAGAVASGCGDPVVGVSVTRGSRVGWR